MPVRSDSLFWEEMRPIPLQAREKEVINRHMAAQKEKACRTANDTLSGVQRAQQMAQRMVMNSSYKYRSSRIGYSGLLNPFMLGYSSRDGVSYRQKLSCNIDLKHNRTVGIDAFAGYLFRQKEFFTDLTTTWNYDPYHLGSATFSAGIGNPTYSSLFVEQIQDSLKNRGLTFEDISLNYYKDYYFKLYNTFEALNGLLLQTGIDYHIEKSKDNTLRFGRSPTAASPSPICLVQKGLSLFLAYQLDAKAILPL